jgi:LPXTG-motif cell wall-anchored protein
MKKLSTAALALGILATGTLAGIAPATAGTDKVTLCHATGNGKYIPITISKDGTANGHAGTQHQDGADIIPAYSWVEGGTRHYFDGQNLEKGADILAAGCQVPAQPVTAAPAPPIYTPATCAVPSLPYGRVTVPADLGDGVASSTAPELNADSTVWSVAYTLKPSTEDVVYSWPAGTTGAYTFDVVPITADPNYVVDSRTGVGACELPETGAQDYLLPAGTGLAALVAGGLMLRRRTA